MTMKRSARLVRQGIFEHRKRTSNVYAELAQAPDVVREGFLSDIRNPLMRKYVAGRIEEERTNLALKRMANNELDPYPYLHEHEGCMVNGQRSDTQDAHDIFSPREGYVSNEEAYQ